MDKNKTPTSPPHPFVRSFADAVPYEQAEPGDAAFRFLLHKDEIPGLQMGLVELSGPIHKTPAAHDAWEQVYLMLEGTGAVHLGDETIRVEAPAMVAIPKDTMHSVELSDGEHLRYVYVNQYH